ncbi:hypothetical protein [Flavicella sediminum]|uniref:hypothetical protein n=1 Tax=Flavicella sediminum TaxID=2585141 RepID=UPI001123ECEF|nr:hypothetical protein [Flavicella sediminum]
MKIAETKPFIHDFKVTGNEDNLPEFLGNFETVDDAKLFISKNFISEHVKGVATRFFTKAEIEEMRSEVHQELEEQQFELKKKLDTATILFEQAKKNKNDAEEALRASMTKVKDISGQIRERTTTVAIDASRSYRLAVHNKYYTYVFTDRFELVLCDVMDIPEYDRKDLFNSLLKNEEAFEKLINGEIKEQKGA